MDLIEAIIHNDIAKVKELLEQGIDPNKADDWANVTPLHYAALLNEVEMVALLVAAGANTDSRDSLDEETPIDVARAHGHDKIVELLLRAHQGRQD